MIDHQLVQCARVRPDEHILASDMDAKLKYDKSGWWYRPRADLQIRLTSWPQVSLPNTSVQHHSRAETHSIFESISKLENNASSEMKRTCLSTSSNVRTWSFAYEPWYAALVLLPLAHRSYKLDK
jgi:hypothetical protein